jgi:hypothetical protein
MSDSLAKELGLLYASIGKTADYDLRKTPPTVHQSDRGVLIHQDFRGGRSDEEIENDLQLVIHNDIGPVAPYW